MHRCAIIQFEAIHEIVTPGIILSLNQNGYKPTLYFNEECALRRGNIFEYCTDLSFELVEFSVKGEFNWESVKSLIKSFNYDFIIINTLQKNKKLDWYLKLGLPLIGIVHNVHILLESELGHELANRDDSFLLTRAPHVNFYLRQKTSFDKTNNEYYIPTYLLDDSRLKEKVFRKEAPLKIGYSLGR